jgi:hypothetical protein
MTSEQRQELMRLLEKGEDLSPEWARILFPPEKREYELVYHGKDREEDIIADTLEKDGWKVRFQTDQLGKKVMAVFLDIYGNEARVLIDAAEFGKDEMKGMRKDKKR